MLKMVNLLDYEVISIMGTGTFGTCFKVRNRLTDKIFVWKAIDYSKFDDGKKQLLVSEINLLKQLSHPNIVKYFNHILSKHTETIYIIMECCEGGDLSMLIRRCLFERCHFEEKFIWRVLWQLSKAIQGCHSYKSSLSILHRDIKPANVFLDAAGNIKLGDFGLARVLEGDENFAESVVGTPSYMSPEIIHGKKYNRKSDIWSLGCLLYELCALVPPFTGRHLESLSKNIIDGRFNRIPEIYSCDMQKIITFLLNVEGEYRPSIEVILHHPTVVSNVVTSEYSLPKLIPDETFDPNPDLSSTHNYEKNNTKHLREDIFDSARRKIFPENSSVSESDGGASDNVIKKSASDCLKCGLDDPKDVTEQVFNDALRRRLEAILEREKKLRIKDNQLKCRERALLKREKQIKSLERLAKEKMITAEKRLNHKSLRSVSNKENVCKKPIRYDDTMITIEPNESPIVPTVAKLNSETIRRPKEFLRKVSFKSPHKPKCETLPDQPSTLVSLNKQVTVVTKPPHTSKDSDKDIYRLGSTNSSTNSKDSQKSIESKRKSIFGLFGLTSNKVKSNSKDDIKFSVSDMEDIESTSEVPLKWNAENKRAAFEMLAKMNAAGENVVNIPRHDRKRQSIVVPKKSHENI